MSCRYELRDSKYTEKNGTLISTARGRTQEFKNWSGEDKGRSVTAKGYWGDILNGPYLSFGYVTEKKSFYEQNNGQFQVTSVDIAEFNVRAMLHEMRTGKPLPVHDPDVPVAPKASGNHLLML